MDLNRRRFLQALGVIAATPYIPVNKTATIFAEPIPANIPSILETAIKWSAAHTSIYEGNMELLRNSPPNMSIGKIQDFFRQQFSQFSELARLTIQAQQLLEKDPAYQAFTKEHKAVNIEFLDALSQQVSHIEKLSADEKQNIAETIKRLKAEAPETSARELNHKTDALETLIGEYLYKHYHYSGPEDIHRIFSDRNNKKSDLTNDCRSNLIGTGGIKPPDKAYYEAYQHIYKMMEGPMFFTPLTDLKNPNPALTVDHFNPVEALANFRCSLWGILQTEDGGFVKKPAMCKQITPRQFSLWLDDFQRHFFPGLTSVARAGIYKREGELIKQTRTVVAQREKIMEARCQEVEEIQKRVAEEKSAHETKSHAVRERTRREEINWPEHGNDIY